jgi:hypothetical protein
VRFEGAFAAGQRIVGRIVPTTADAEVARMQEPYAGKPLEIAVERVEPMRLFSFRWHPFAVDEDYDYGKEPTTLVELVLAGAPGGTRLTITESGFDGIPLSRRARAFTANDGGWTAQAQLIAKYLAQP